MARPSSMTFSTAPPTEEKAAVRSGVLARIQAFLDPVFGIDLRTLGAFRIGLALLVLADLFQRAGDLTGLYTDQGIFPLKAVRQLHNTDWILLSPFMWADTAQGVALLFTLLGLAAFAMLIGYRTRLATLATWFLVASLHTRTPLLLHSGDTLTRLMLFWALFLPLGARFSADGLAARLVARRQPLPQRVLSWGSAGLLLQIAFMYWFTAVLKTGDEWRVEGTALYYALGIEQYATTAGQWLLFHARWALKPLTFGTLALETFGPMIALFPVATERVRLFMIPVFLVFHLGIYFCMDIGSFPWVCAVAWSAFLPSLFWDGLARLWLRLPNSAVKEAIEQVRESLIRWRSRRIAAGARRGERPPQLRLSPLGQAAAVFFLVFIFLWNAHSTDLAWAKALPNLPKDVIWLTRVDQGWGMFSPRPLRDDGWFVIPARTVGGAEIDLFRGGAPVRWGKPAWIPFTYQNQRWCRHLMNLWQRDNGPYRVYYCQYLAREWNRTHRGRDAVTSVRMYYMHKYTLPDYVPPQPKKVLLCTCDVETGSSNMTGVTASAGL